MDTSLHKRAFERRLCGDEFRVPDAANGSSSADHSAAIKVSNAAESWRQDLDVGHGSWPTFIFDSSSVEAGQGSSAATGNLRHATVTPARELAPKSGEHFGSVALPRGGR